MKKYLLAPCVCLLVACNKEKTPCFVQDIEMIAKSPEQTIITVGNTVDYHYSIKITTDCDDFSDQINSRLAISKQDDQTGEFIPTGELKVSDEFVGNKTIDSKILLTVGAPGTYRFSFCADYDNRFEERDEGNNCQ